MLLQQIKIALSSLFFKERMIQNLIHVHSEVGIGLQKIKNELFRLLLYDRCSRKDNFWKFFCFLSVFDYLLYIAFEGRLAEENLIREYS